MDKILYGVAYYDEYMPYDRLADDITLMKKANINVVRIAESTWSTLEPENGKYNFYHIDRALNAMENAGISVIIGTPTYAIPSWLALKYPEILVETKTGKALYGRRQNMDITNPNYLFHAERVIRKLMEHVANRGCVIGYQIDNETKHYGTSGYHVQNMFLQELQQKNSDIEMFNKEFGLDYWSNRINSWDDFPNVVGTINASLGAEFSKFQRNLVSKFLEWQAGIINEYKRPDQFVTHNFDFDWIGHSYGVQPDVNHFEASKCLTVVGCDVYHPSQDHLTGAEISFCGDMARSLKQDNYLVLETQAQGMNNWLPYKGQLRLQAFSHIASGANMIEYWHWHSIHNSFESYWKGLLDHDFSENPTYNEAKVIGMEFARLSDRLLNLKKMNKTAILVNNESLTGLEWFKISNNTGYNDIVRWVYDELYRMNIGCDVINTDEKDFDRYKMIVIPALYSVSDEVLKGLNDYVKKGGHLIVTFKSGFSNENLKISCKEQPNILSECCGISYSQFTVPENVTLNGLDLQNNEQDVREWMELITPTTANVIANYNHPQWSDYAAITKNQFGKGSAVYIGCLCSSAVLREIIANEIKEFEIYDIEQKYYYPIIVKKCIDTQGNEMIFLFNYSGNQQTITYYFKSGWEIINNYKVEHGNNVVIEPWGLLVISQERNRNT